jgi:aminopeptidase N
VGLYEAGDPSGAPFVIKNVIVSGNDDTIDVDISSLPQDFQFGAVYLNQDDHAYAKVRFDRHSINWLTENLSHISDALTRAAIWRYFWMLVMDRKMSSLKYVEFV